MTKEKTKIDPIHKDMTIDGVITLHPEIYDVLMRYGLHCIGCHGSAFETLDQGLSAHGFSEKELDDVIQELNEIIGAVKKRRKIIVKEPAIFEITLTKNALNKIQAVAKEEGKTGWPLRVEVKKIAGKFKYSMNFIEVNKTTPNDKVFPFASDKIKVVADKSDGNYLNGLEIDYIQEEGREGFKMNNPN